MDPHDITEHAPSTVLVEPTPSLADRFVDKVGIAIYGIRWILAPMYLGLWIAMIGYLYHYCLEINRFIFEVIGWCPMLREHDSNDWLLFLLELIDITMIGNLVVMITIGGFSTFVKEFDAKALEHRPRWMNGLDSSTLKIKMCMSLVGVTAVHLLKTFIDLDQHPITDDFYKHIIIIGLQIFIHVIFIGSMLAFTFNAKHMHPHAPSADPHGK